MRVFDQILDDVAAELKHDNETIDDFLGENLSKFTSLEITILSCDFAVQSAILNARLGLLRRPDPRRCAEHLLQKVFAFIHWSFFLKGKVYSWFCL